VAVALEPLQDSILDIQLERQLRARRQAKTWRTGVRCLGVNAWPSPPTLSRHGARPAADQPGRGGRDGWL